MIIISGAAGFIGSCLCGFLEEKGEKNVIAVDDFSKKQKDSNLQNKSIHEFLERDQFFDWFHTHADEVDFVYHIGARTDTTEFNVEIFNKLNLDYSKTIWEICSIHQIPLIYASSAATYGMGELGYKDEHDIIPKLKPLNPYGESKNDFDKWVLEQDEKPPFWAGLKFFNVYGPNEYHKERMASVIFHAFHQIQQSGGMKLFRSHHNKFQDGEQLRDFVYVKDVMKVIHYLAQNKPIPGIYNLGTGKARTFLDLAKAVFNAMDINPKIEFIDTPEDIRNNYQYFTEADIAKLRKTGYKDEFYSLEEGVEDYVRNYLSTGKHY